MKNLISVFVFCLVVLSINSYPKNNTKTTRFTSVYTDLNKDCRTDEGGDGQDSTYDCRGVGGYRITSDSAASAAFYYLKTPDGESIRFATQNFDYDHSKYKAEWRHANGKPFALIMRFFNYSESKDESAFFGKKTGEYLKVLGLKGFDNIDFEVDAKTPNANQKARDLADNGYAEKTSGSADRSAGIIILDMNEGGVLGTYKAGKFSSGENISINPNDSFKLFGLGMENKSLQYKELENADKCVYYPCAGGSNGFSGVALSSNISWNPVPREPQVLDPNGKTYQKFVRDFVIKNGISKPNVKIHQILLVDLEGDGQDEVIIAAGSDAPDDINAYFKGEYALLMVRKIFDGKVQNILLDGWFNKTQLSEEVFKHKGRTFEVTAVLDLDGDGQLEIVAYDYEHEGGGSNVHKINGRKSIKVLNSGSGV